MIKFDGKKFVRCYAISFDYDDWSYTVNEKAKKELPEGVKSITVVVE